MATSKPEAKPASVSSKTDAGPPEISTDAVTSDPPPQSKPARQTRRQAKPEPKRAGGYVDRGDGHGWVLDDSPRIIPRDENPPLPKSAPRRPKPAGGWVLPGQEQE